MVYWTPYPWYFDPLSMVFWPPYPWYFDPPIYGVLNSLPMVFWSPYPAYLLIRNEGVNIPWMNIDSGVKIPYDTGFVTRLTQQVSLVEQELLTLPEHLSSPPVISGVRVTRSLVLYVCFVNRCLSFCTFSFGHCVVCFSSIYGFWLPLWYLQTLLMSLSHRWS